MKNIREFLFFNLSFLYNMGASSALFLKYKEFNYIKINIIKNNFFNYIKKKILCIYINVNCQ